MEDSKQVQEGSIIGDLYFIRRRLEKEEPNCRERNLALTKIDEALFWIDSIPIPID